MLQPSGAEELQKPELVRVLLLEDERVTAEVVGQYLRRIPGLAVQLETASTLAAARALLARGAFDLLIVDLHLPDSSGLATVQADTVRSLRKSEARLRA